MGPERPASPPTRSDSPESFLLVPCDLVSRLGSVPLTPVPSPLTPKRCPNSEAGPSSGPQSRPPGLPQSQRLRRTQVQMWTLSPRASSLGS
jgi:hypothetical protein